MTSGAHQSVLEPVPFNIFIKMGLSAPSARLWTHLKGDAIQRDLNSPVEKDLEVLTDGSWI